MHKNKILFANEEGLSVLSICDGISCGLLALQKCGFKIKNYYASEIKETAIKVSKYNNPQIIHIGDVNKITYDGESLHTELGDFKVDFDLVIFGSPCQTFSVAMKPDKRIGLADKEKSGLFLECYRVLKEINPKYFLMENVASMRDSDRDYISKLMGVQPLRINSAICTPCLRDRYYWTNIEVEEMPKEKNIKLQDILIDGYTNRDKGHCLVAADSRPMSTPVKMFHRYYYKGFGNLIFKSKEHFDDCKVYYDQHYRGMKAKDIPVHETDIFDGVRYLNQEELEKCQTLPIGYTSCLSRNEAADVIGDGWTVDIISHIFKYIK